MVKMNGKIIVYYKDLYYLSFITEIQNTVSYHYWKVSQ